MMLRWSHAVVYVRDLEGMIDYYSRVLGFEVTDRGTLADRGPELVFMSQDPDDHHQLAFVPVRQGEEPSNSVNHFAFRVDSIGDVRDLAARLEEDGRTTDVRPVTHGNTWSIYFSDPEGNGIEVFTDTPWHVQQPQGGAWDMSLSDDELIAATREQFESEPGFMPADEFHRRQQARFRR